MSRRIVAAAVRSADGFIVVGVRHFDKLMHDQIDQMPKYNGVDAWRGATQGFVDNHGTFVDRKEAWAIASAAEQIDMRSVHILGSLQSEDLW